MMEFENKSGSYWHKAKNPSDSLKREYEGYKPYNTFFKKLNGSYFLHSEVLFIVCHRLNENYTVKTWLS